MYKSFVLRIYPDEDQEAFFTKQFGCCRYVFNTFLSEKQLHYSLFKRYLDENVCSAMLTEQKKFKSWLKEVDSLGLVNSLKNLESSFNLFFKGVNNFPRFKSKYNSVQSYTTNYVNNNIRIEGNCIRLPKVGFVRFRAKRRIIGKIKSVTVKRKASGKYFVSILCEYDNNVIYRMNNRSCGLDLGIKNFITINTGEIIHFPQQNKIIRLNNRIKRLQRKLSKKTPGSKNYHKIKKKISKTYEKIHNILQYHFYKIAQILIEKYQIICLETLNIKGMLKNSKISQQIQEKSWHMFIKILQEKAEEHQRTIIQIDLWYPSSKTCNKCGYINKKLELNNRTWTCPKCQTKHHRDINAAKNIHKEGLQINTQKQ